jgi:hypothetical protein
MPSVLDSFAFDHDEAIESVISLTFEADSNEYYVVGTARPTPEDSNVHRGRLRVFTVLPTRHLKLVTELDVLGAPFVLREFNGKLIAGINGKVSNRKTITHILRQYGTTYDFFN